MIRLRQRHPVEYFAVAGFAVFVLIGLRLFATDGSTSRAGSSDLVLGAGTLVLTTGTLALVVGLWREVRRATILIDPRHHRLGVRIAPGRDPRWVDLDQVRLATLAERPHPLAQLEERELELWVVGAPGSRRRRRFGLRRCTTHAAAVSEWSGTMPELRAFVVPIGRLGPPDEHQVLWAIPSNAWPPHVDED